MTAATLDRPVAAERDRSGPSLVRLTVIEMRKFVDTRSGFWLLVVIALLSAALVPVQLIWPSDQDGNFTSFLQLPLFPTSVLLPVLGVLTVTTEWSQRTALTTFTLVPRRERVLIAKLAAAVIFGLLAVVVSLAVAAVGTALAQGFDRGATAGDWSLPASALGQVALLEVLSVVMGVAFGMLLLNTPLAIVVYFVLPMVFTIVTATVKAVEKASVWLDVNGAMDPMTSGSMTSKDWQHLATSGAVFILLPLVAGAWRVLRREVQ